MNNKILRIVIGCLTIGMYAHAHFQEGSEVASTAVVESARVIHYEELKYPVLAQYARGPSEGVVVARVNLDQQGNVERAVAISGSDVLVPDSLSNVKNWRFQPNSTKTAVVVYRFRRLEGECKSPGSVFTFRAPNLATVAGCWPAVSSPLDIQLTQESETLSDKDLGIAHFEELKYPAVAKSARLEGPVVIQVELDDKGNVRSAEALSGNKLLASACLDNIKRWRFRVNKQRRSVVMYDFRLSLDDMPEGSQFTVEQPDLVVIKAQPMTIQPAR